MLPWCEQSGGNIKRNRVGVQGNSLKPKFISKNIPGKKREVSMKRMSSTQQPKGKQSTLKMDKRYFTKLAMWVASWHMKSRSSSLTIREGQSKTTVPLLKWPLQSGDKSKCQPGYRASGSSPHAAGHTKWGSHSGKHLGSFL